MKSANDNKSLIIVAPNGARLSKKQHPNVPISAQEIANEARACADAGAAMIHLHSRDLEGEHSLAIEDNRRVLDAVKETVGDRMIVQLTTEAIGKYSIDQQMSLIRELVPDAATFAIRELIPDRKAWDVAADFFAWTNANLIIAQFILYSEKDYQSYVELNENGVIPDSKHQLLFVVGRHSIDGFQTIDEVTQLIKPDTLSQTNNRWAVCAFGKQEFGLLDQALDTGGDVRVGFENNCYDRNGELAKDNAAQVASIAELARSKGKRLHSAASFRQALT